MFTGLIPVLRLLFRRETVTILKENLQMCTSWFSLWMIQTCYSQQHYQNSVISETGALLMVFCAAQVEWQTGRSVDLSSCTCLQPIRALQVLPLHAFACCSSWISSLNRFFFLTGWLQSINYLILMITFFYISVSLDAFGGILGCF